MLPDSLMTRLLKSGVSVWVILASLAIPASAVPTLMNYQGNLTDDNGNPRTGTFAMTFGLYADPTGVSPLWIESHPNVAVQGGVFNVLLGSVAPVPSTLFTGDVLWLQTTIEDTDLMPRLPIVSVGYAFRSSVADTALSGPGSPWTIDGLDLFRADGNVGIGSVQPTEKLDVVGTVQAMGFRLVTGAVPGYVLTSDADGNATWQPLSSAGTIGGSGAPNKVPVFSSSTMLTTSEISQSGSNVGISTSTPVSKLEVHGDLGVGANGNDFRVSSSGKIETESVTTNSIEDQAVTSEKAALTVLQDSLSFALQPGPNFQLDLDIPIPPSTVARYAMVVFSAAVTGAVRSDTVQVELRLDTNTSSVQRTGLRKMRVASDDELVISSNALISIPADAQQYFVSAYVTSSQSVVTLHHRSLEVLLVSQPSQATLANSPTPDRRRRQGGRRQGFR